MRIASVNVGQPQLNPWKTIKLTGIDKRPVDGPVMVSRPRAKGMGMVGLAADSVRHLPGVAGAGRLGQAVHPGRQARALLPGDRAGRDPAGDQIEVVHRPDHDVTVALSFLALTIEPELLPRLLVADALPGELKDLARRRTA